MKQQNQIVLGRCIKSNKIKYGNKCSAKQEIKDMTGRGIEGSTQLRAFLCESCNYFHIGKPIKNVSRLAHRKIAENK